MIAPGTRFGQYEIVAALGSGGMGEVYRARDAKLNRDVAIKLLPAVFAADPERLARFEREARTLAALNHPNVAHIYGVLDEPPALVMELVEGEDLAQRIARGRVPLDDALPIARQIADALEAAHDQGIVHRDLKPANVKVRPDGTVKVLDFGLAKAMDPVTGSSGAPLANSPTFTSQGTQLGLIIGTAAYMAPEQARGKAVDRRADVWGFGAVLYEMLTGRRAFEGDEISDVLASVLKSEPSWAALPSDTPGSIRRLLQRCLEKDPRKRLSAIGDARFDLDETPPALPKATRRSLVPYVLIVLASVLATAAVAVWIMRSPATVGVRRFSLLPPPDATLYADSTGVAISPDGTMVAFLVGDVARSDTQLWVRPLDSLEAHRLDGTAGAALPFWSPDSKQIGYFTNTKLMTVPVAGGHAQAIADVKGGGRGASWSAANVIVFAPEASGPLYRVPASGGTAVQVTTLDTAQKQYGHRFPSFLPDGDHFLYAALPGRNGRFDIFVASLSGGPPTRIAALESAPVYGDGYLLYGRQGVLMACPFNPASLKLTGDPIALADEPASVLDPMLSFTAGRVTSVAANGTIAYYSAPSKNTIAQWFDAQGRPAGTIPLPPGHYENLRISPDGTQAVFVRSVSPSESSLWLVDLARGGAVPLTNAPSRNDSPVWSPDSSKIVFASDRDGGQDLFIRTIGDAAPERLLFRSPIPFKNPTSWSPDGAWIVVNELDPETAQNIWLLPSGGSREMTPFLIGPRRDAGGVVSPDGRWVAYLSDESSRIQLYVQPFPKGGRAVQVSQEGSMGVTWARDGRELRFVSDDFHSIWRVDVTGGPTFTASAPKLVARLPSNVLFVDIAPDLQRYLAVAPERTGTGSITVAQNWRAAVAR